MAAGVAASNTIESGGAFEEALLAGYVSSEAMDKGLSLAAAVAKGASAGRGDESASGCMPVVSGAPEGGACRAASQAGRARRRMACATPQF